LFVAIVIYILIHMLNCVLFVPRMSYAISVNFGSVVHKRNVFILNFLLKKLFPWYLGIWNTRDSKWTNWNILVPRICSVTNNDTLRLISFIHSPLRAVTFSWWGDCVPQWPG